MAAAASCWLLAAGRWLLAASCWPLAAGCWLPVSSCWPPRVRHAFSRLRQPPLWGGSWARVRLYAQGAALRARKGGYRVRERGGRARQGERAGIDSLETASLRGTVCHLARGSLRIQSGAPPHVRQPPPRALGRRLARGSVHHVRHACPSPLRPPRLRVRLSQQHGFASGKGGCGAGGARQEERGRRSAAGGARWEERGAAGGARREERGSRWC